MSGPNVGPASGIEYVIVNTATKLALGSENNSVTQDNRVIAWPSDGSVGQNWFLEGEQDKYKVKNINSGKYLGYEGDANQNVPCRIRSEPQLWAIKKAQEPNTWVILPANSWNNAVTLVESSQQVITSLGAQLPTQIWSFQQAH